MNTMQFHYRWKQKITGLLLPGLLAVHLTSGAACIPPPDGLVSWWRADGNATDALGANNGTISGATFTAGEVGQAFNFDGSGQKITVADNDSLKLTNSLAIEGWIYANGIIIRNRNFL